MTKAKVKEIPNADGRPRVYIATLNATGRAVWGGTEHLLTHHAETPGAALDEALARLGGQKAVIIYKGRI